jgi:Txe/YoeB family toxin of Txe-Axe toxin-antitoxin module
MRIIFTSSAWEDYLWLQQHDRKLLKRVNYVDKGNKSLSVRGHWQTRAFKGRFVGLLVAAN